MSEGEDAASGRTDTLGGMMQAGATTPADMVALLRGHALRCRTGLLLLPPGRLSDAPDIAARLGLDALDYAQALIDSLPPAAKFVPLTAESEETRLDGIAEDRQGADAVLVYNVDLAISKLDTRQRTRLWSALCDRLPHRRRALVLAMPRQADRLLPPDGDRPDWRGRLAEWPDDAR